MGQADKPKVRLSIGGETPAGVKPHWVPIWCNHHFGNLAHGIYECPLCDPGPQVRTLWTPAREILLGGARGGAKTECGRGWLMKGNIQAHPTDPRAAICEPIDHRDGHIMIEQGGVKFCSLCVNASYIAHPRYRALVLRENEKDLADWIFRAKLMYEPLGATVTEKPARVTWPSKATFILGHMRDEGSYSDYIGQEFQRIVFEELTLIPNEILYLRIIGSCRSTFSCDKGCEPGTCICGVLREQILATTNPGGKGHGWCKKRFISIGDPNKVHTDRNGLTRTYIPALVDDNPYLLKNVGYMAWLESLPEPTRSAWRYGDWDAVGGQYFVNFRPKGPLIIRDYVEPKEANHVVNSGSYPLQPWWPRWIGGDWGFKHNFAFYWCCQDPNGRIIIYRELTGHEIGSKELGAAVARATFPDLEGLSRQRVEPKMTLWLSPDAFGKRDDELTTAENFVAGIEKVMGPKSAYFPDMWYQIRNTEPTWEGHYYTDYKVQQNFGIAVRKAQTHRVMGWEYCRELMRWNQIQQADKSMYDHNYALMLMHDDPKRYILYRDSFEARKPEVLPKLVIFGDTCPKLVEAIPTAMYAEESEDVMKTEEATDDCLDGMRYALHSQNAASNKEPQKSYVERHLAEVRKNEPGVDFNSLVWAARKAEEEYASMNTHKVPLNFPVEGTRAFKMNRSKRVN